MSDDVERSEEEILKLVNKWVDLLILLDIIMNGITTHIIFKLLFYALMKCIFVKWWWYWKAFLCFCLFGINSILIIS